MTILLIDEWLIKYIIKYFHVKKKFKWKNKLRLQRLEKAIKSAVSGKLGYKSVIVSNLK